jgi:DNA (cytosine-5)-methyltransferase 1
VTGYSLRGRADYRAGPGTLRASGGDVGGGGETICVATLNSGGNNGGFRTEPGAHLIAHALRSEGADASEDGTGRGTPIVIGFDRTRSTFSGDVAAPLRANGGASEGVNDGKADNQCVALRETAATLTRSLDKNGINSAGDSVPNWALGQYGVRRLTPVECERLQGFPDDHTRYAADGKELSDSARYRMLGNAVAVPCAEWIGRRIVEAA